MVAMVPRVFPKLLNPSSAAIPEDRLAPNRTFEIRSERSRAFDAVARHPSFPFGLGKFRLGFGHERGELGGLGKPGMFPLQVVQIAVEIDQVARCGCEIRRGRLCDLR